MCPDYDLICQTRYAGTDSCSTVGANWSSCLSSASFALSKKVCKGVLP